MPKTVTQAGAPETADKPDSLTEFALERLLSTTEGWRRLMREAVAQWPDASPLSIVFATVNASAQIEAIFAEGSPSRKAAQHGFRIAGLLSADLYAMEALGLPRNRAADVMAYWQNHDDYFLTL
ncbi:hypothetical protein RGUI_3601 [Rhodovulum sp. P5]|uniref:hypothetical protein n=1 Tax=Rhodovulum sp. P5 TaxID=1564506 RepID=UPI0009C2FE30|nr:hypothetical protein [Rhodovulum sp. P5]ARE41742.1 hypothetical protein RGUI_3601 [Rhodovulum sp. P5]